MIPVAVTQRVDLKFRIGERRDALDQRWSGLLSSCGLLPILVPNTLPVARALLAQVPVGGILLTGGNDPVACGGDAPERDETENWLIRRALDSGLPLLGVCRGMQMIQQHFGVPLHPVSGHVCAEQQITVSGVRTSANSYHRFGATGSVTELEVWAVADDGVVKAVRHRSKRVLGFMWHPERFAHRRESDIALIRRFFQPG